MGIPTAILGHGPALLSMEANDGFGSTTVHPSPCGNRQQWVESGPSRRGGSMTRMRRKHGFGVAEI